MMPLIRRMLALLAATIALAISPSSLSPSSSSALSLHSHTGVLLAHAQIIRDPLSDVDRAREEALRSGRLREFDSLYKQRARRRAAAATRLPAPGLVVKRADGVEEMYTPDRERRIRVPKRRRHARVGSGAGAGVDKRARRREGRPLPHSSQRHEEGRAHAPHDRPAATRKPPRLQRFEEGAEGMPSQPAPRTTLAAGAEQPAASPGAQSLAAEQQSGEQLSASDGTLSRGAPRLPPKNKRKSNATAPVSASARRDLQRAYSADPRHLPSNEEGRVFNESFFTPAQLAALRSLDGESAEDRQGAKHSQALGGAGAYLDRMVSTLIAPQVAEKSLAVAAQPTRSNAMGTALIVVLPLLLLVGAFVAYATLVYTQRRSAEAAAQAKAERINSARAAARRGSDRDGKQHGGSSPKKSVSPVLSPSNPRAHRSGSEEWEVCLTDEDV